MNSENIVTAIVVLNILQG